MTVPPPEPSSLPDHAVEQRGDYLDGKQIALLVTGSVAAMKAPLLVRELRRYGATVNVFASEQALRYVGAEALRWACNTDIVTQLTRRSEHLHRGKPYDAYLVAPASYNTINKMAQGIADGVVTTTLASALGYLDRRETQVLVAPAMHGSMHNTILQENLARLQKLGVRVIKPRQQYFKDNLPSQEVLLSEVCRAVHASRWHRMGIGEVNQYTYRTSGHRVLVTAGAVGVKVDAIRRLTNKFSGKLGILIAQEAYLRGHDVTLLQSSSGIRPPKWLTHHLYDDYDEYLDLCLQLGGNHDYGIYSAAVADYRPAEAAEGKIASGRSELSLQLIPTLKVIDEVRKAHPDHKLISFKYEHDATLNQLVQIADKRCADGHTAVVVNSGSIRSPDGKQMAYLFSHGADPKHWPRIDGNTRPMIGKPAIAAKLIDELEKTPTIGAFAPSE